MNKFLLSIASCFLYLATCYAQPPNFVIVVLDDQGWTGSSVQMDPNLPGSKSDFFQTPSIERLAGMGMVFPQGYAPAPKCAPSRASILTGRSTARNGFTNTDNVIADDQILIEATTSTSIDASLTTYSEWLKATGLNYRTAHLGKWHLGSTPETSPSTNGFDVEDGNTNNSNGNTGTTINDDPKNLFDVTSRSIAFMRQAVTDGDPFALQISHYAVHEDVECRQATLNLYQDDSERPEGTRHTRADDGDKYAAMTEDTDTVIGTLLDELEALNILDNTYIFFLSDNGGQINYTNNTPLTYGKTFIYEGGIRVPFIAVGPRISAGSYAGSAAVGYDLFPTLAELSGSAQALPANLDGTSLVPVLEGSTLPNRYLFFHSPHYDRNPNKTPRSAVIEENYKLLVDYETGQASLFDLETDIRESTDLSATLPDYARELLLVLRDHLKETNANMPTLDTSHASFSGTGNDVDNDGLADAWEFSELLSYTYGADDDPDNDGKTNMEEYQAGTDPLSSSEEVSCNASVVYSNESSHAVCMQLEEQVRNIYTNNYPPHDFGPWNGNNDLKAQDLAFTMCQYPELGDEVTELIADPTSLGCGNGVTFGLSIEGILFDPFARLYWENPNTNEENTDWVIEAAFELQGGIDDNGGHVNTINKYHYHHAPDAYYADLGIGGSAHSPIVGYAADGYPIYYKYVYEDPQGQNQTLMEITSSYQLKSGPRPGDGISAPNGDYDGNYVQDYEYVPDLSALDECNGRIGITPDYPEGTYYYVLTADWPYIPRCLRGKYVDNTFRIGPNCPDSTALDDCSLNPISLELEDGSGSPETSFEISLYPNPTSATVYIENAGGLVSKLILFDSKGRMLQTLTPTANELDMSPFSSGVYYVHIESGDQVITKRIVKK